MRGKIFLAGGGSAEQSVAVDTLWLEEIADDDRGVLYIPWAQKKGKHETASQWFLATYGRRLAERAIITCALDADLSDIDRFASVYIGGGNTRRLLDRIHKNNARGNLENYIHNGGSVYGGSAGAIVLGKTIETAPEVDINGDDIEGLNMLDGYSVVCHYEKEEPIDNRYAPIVAIPETGGAVFDGDAWKTVGDTEFLK